MLTGDEAVKVKQVNELYKDARTRADNAQYSVKVSDTQPQESRNQLWIKSGSATEISVPTYAEHQQVSNKVSALEDIVADEEETSTATSAHAIKTVFQYDGKLWMTTSAIAVGDTIVTNGAGANVVEVKLADAFPHDVQVNGTSILNSGVANVPLASENVTGAIKLLNSNGTGINQGALCLSKATDTQLKDGLQNFRPVVPSNQHTAVFYGLAKASGDTSQSASSNAVGVYTADALVKIQKMLGVYDRWEKIVEYTTNEDLTAVTVSLDESGQAFELSEMYIRAELPVPTTASNDYVSAAILVKTNDDTNASVSTVTLRYQSGTSKLLPVYGAKIICGVVESYGRQGVQYSSTQTNQGMSSPSASYKCIRGFKLSQYSQTNTLIPSGTKIIIYGKRIFN